MNKKYIWVAGIGLVALGAYWFFTHYKITFEAKKEKPTEEEGGDFHFKSVFTRGQHDAIAREAQRMYDERVDEMYHQEMASVTETEEITSDEEFVTFGENGRFMIHQVDEVPDYQESAFDLENIELLPDHSKLFVPDSDEIYEASENGFFEELGLHIKDIECCATLSKTDTFIIADTRYEILYSITIPSDYGNDELPLLPIREGE